MNDDDDDGHNADAFIVYSSNTIHGAKVIHKKDDNHKNVALRI